MYVDDQTRVAAAYASGPAVAFATRGDHVAAGIPPQGVADARAVHVVCLGSGSADAAALAEEACRIAVHELRAAGRRDASALSVGDVRTGEAGRLIVGLRVDVQGAGEGLPPLVVLSGQTLRPDIAGGRVTPVPARALPRTAGRAPDHLTSSIVALLRDLGVM